MLHAPWFRSVGSWLRRAAPLAALALATLPLTLAGAAPSADSGQLDLYTLQASPEQMEILAQEGFDVLEMRNPRSPVSPLVLSPQQKAQLEARGLRPRLWLNPQGQTARQEADAAQQTPFKVWKHWDGEGGLKAEVYELAAKYPNLTTTTVLGKTHQGSEIVAIRVTKDAKSTADGSRPSVLYISLQHAREWIGPEVNRRILHHLLENYGTDTKVTNLVDTREFWFILVCNPDGYERTFGQGTRLWRKNTRDNNGDGQITNGDGVDPNRNFANHWNYDNEGASNNPGSDTYRGPSAESEPETQALVGLLKRLKPTFLINYHSVAQLILYGVGWQVNTATADNPIFEALSGNPGTPAIAGFTPEVSAALYITNGETCDYAYGELNITCMTVELSDAGTGGGFVFPDDEAKVQEEFVKNLPFALDIAETAADPTKPVSHLGNTVQPMYATEFPVSYGDPQTVEVNAMRKLGRVEAHYKINGGAQQIVPTTEWKGGKLYGDVGQIYYHTLRAKVSGAKPGDKVSVWFEAPESEGASGAARTQPFEYTLFSNTKAPALVLAVEDYKGQLPAMPGGPMYLQQYVAALKAAGMDANVYDFDAMGRMAPSALGVLDHHKLVVWYTGQDLMTMNLGDTAVTYQAKQLELSVRDFINEGGKLIWAGSHAGWQYNTSVPYNTYEQDPCVWDGGQKNGSTCPFTNDFMQYYMGVNGFNYRSGLKDNATMWSLKDKNDAPSHGFPQILDGLGATFGALSPTPGLTMTRQPFEVLPSYGMVWLPTSEGHPEATYPQFKSQVMARYDHAETAHSGNQALAVYGNSYTYRRLSRTINLTDSTSAGLSFWINRGDWPEWGNAFVEVRTNGKDDWTTLPDENGHTSNTISRLCTEMNGYWLARYPFLSHYMTRTLTAGTPVCVPQGSSGTWNAATGASDGWEEWRVDLGPYLGQQVEVAISFIIGSTVRPAAFVDDITIAGGSPLTGTLSTSFELTGTGQAALEGWRDGGSPPGPGGGGGGMGGGGGGGGGARFGVETPGVYNLARGPVIATADTVLMSFGIEQLATPALQGEMMRRLAVHLLKEIPGPGPGTPDSHKVYLPVGYKE